MFNYISLDTENFYIKLSFLGPKTRSAPNPKPLFSSPESYIDDYFTGDILSAFSEADDYENAFFMFYSPWDADSIRAVEIFETIGKIFLDQDLYIAAINCWEPTSQCFKDLKIKKNPRLSQHQYPIFIFYPKDR